MDKPTIYYAHPEEYYYTLGEAQPGTSHEELVAKGNDCYVEYAAYEKATKERDTYKALAEKLAEALREIEMIDDTGYGFAEIADQALSHYHKTIEEMK